MNQNDFNNQQPVQPVQTVVPQNEPIQQVAPVQPTMVQPPVQSIDGNQPKKKSKLPIILVILVLILAGGGTGAYFLFFHKVTAKQVVDGTINALFSKATYIEKAADKVFTYSLKNDTIEMAANVNVDIEGNIQGEKLDFKNIDLKGNAIINVKDMEASTNISTSQNSKDILTFSAFLKNDKGYFNSNVFANPYSFDMKDTTFWEEMRKQAEKVPEYNSNDIKTITNKTKTFLKNTIKDEYLTQDTGSYTLDATSIDGVKTTVKLNDTRIKEMQIYFYDQIIADDEFISLLAKYEMTTSEEIKNDLMDLRDELKTPRETLVAEKEYTYDINIYTSKQGKFLGLEFIVDGKVYVTGVSNNNITTYKLYDEKGNVSYTFTYNETTKEYTFKIGEYTLNVTFTEDMFKLGLTGQDLELNVTFNTKLENDSVSYDLDLNGSYKESTSSIKGGVKLGLAVKKVDKIESFDVSNAKDANELTPEEEQAMEAKFAELINGTYIQTIMEIIQAMNTPQYATMDTTTDIYPAL